MDLLRLDKETYLPDAIVEEYRSVIWTERYLENGEFQLKTPYIEETIALIPEGSLVTLRDSFEVMLVETHSIEVDPNGNPELTVTGRSLETFLENRVLMAPVYGEPWQVLQTYTTSDMVSLLLWHALVNTSGEDVTYPDKVVSTYTALGNAVVTNSSTLTETAQNWWLEAGVNYKTVIDFLALQNLGIQIIRPSGTTGNVVTFDTTRTATRGTITKTPTSNIMALRVDVHNGLNRTKNQNERPSVIFHYGAGHIDSPKYLFSIRDLKTFATVVSSIGRTNVWQEDPPPDIYATGLDRRTLFVDGGTQGDLPLEYFQALIVQKGLVELKKHNRAALFDGAISTFSPFEYNKDYLLGDYVTLASQYGFEASMQVSEYVRTNDESGDRGYPGLTLLT